MCSQAEPGNKQSVLSVLVSAGVMIKASPTFKAISAGSTSTRGVDATSMDYVHGVVYATSQEPLRRDERRFKPPLHFVVRVRRVSRPVGTSPVGRKTKNERGGNNPVTSALYDSL